MSENLQDVYSTENFKVIIVGGGLVGLALGQGLQKNGIACSIYEQLPPHPPPQGWGLSLSFAVDHLLSLLPSDLAKRFKHVQTNPEQEGPDHYKFFHYNTATGEAAYDVSGGFGRLRVHRDKLWRLLAEGLDIHWDKRFLKMSFLNEGVELSFADGTTCTGSLVIGADGSGSVVRKIVCPDGWQPYTLPVNGTGVSVRYTLDKLRPVLELDPLFFQASRPDNNSFMFYSTMDTSDSIKDNSYTVQVFVSWSVEDEQQDSVAETDNERLENMRRRTEDWMEPFRGLVSDIPEGTSVKAVKISDWVPQVWDNHDGRVTLIGDAAHTMTMYRGEAVNHGFMDAANLVKALKGFKSSNRSLKDIINGYEKELKDRNREAVILSRQACLDAHNWNNISPKSPLVDRSQYWGR